MTKANGTTYSVIYFEDKITGAAKFKIKHGDWPTAYATFDIDTPTAPAAELKAAAYATLENDPGLEGLTLDHFVIAAY